MMRMREYSTGTLGIYKTLRHGILFLWKDNTIGNITKDTKGADTALPHVQLG